MSTSSPALAAALAQAHRAARGAPFSAPSEGRTRPRLVALGDPQAPLAQVLSVLASHGLLGPAGFLREDVHLVSVGDHFDWGGPSERGQAAEDGLALLAWLAAHPPEAVTLLVGNHDLARVGELAGFDDARFAAAQAEADGAYQAGRTDAAREATLLARFPEVPSAEVVARDLSSFRAVQRTWVVHLLAWRRFHLGLAAGPHLLVTHAGLTLDEVQVLGLPAQAQADAPLLAQALNEALWRAFDAWDGLSPLVLPGLHRPGSARGGEGVGMLYHRASLRPEDAPLVQQPPPRRRFDPRRLPRGLTQVVGHVRDAKCRALLLGDETGARDGVLRTLTVTGETVDYRHGVPQAPPGPDAAHVIYVDAGMRHVAPEAYPLLELSPLPSPPGRGQG